MPNKEVIFNYPYSALSIISILHQTIEGKIYQKNVPLNCSRYEIVSLQLLLLKLNVIAPFSWILLSLCS